MPIFEYHCNDCGTNFEELLLSRSAKEPENCASCGGEHVHKKHSTFAARGSSGTGMEACATPAMCRTGPCGSGMCNMN